MLRGNILAKNFACRHRNNSIVYSVIRMWKKYFSKKFKKYLLNISQSKKKLYLCRVISDCENVGVGMR